MQKMANEHAYAVRREHESRLAADLAATNEARVAHSQLAVAYGERIDSYLETAASADDDGSPTGSSNSNVDLEAGVRRTVAAVVWPVGQ